MALIFDRFPSITAAVTFASTVAVEHELDVAVFHDVGAAQAADPIPVELTPPIVHIDRSDDPDLETQLEILGEAFGARFAGT